MPIPAIPLLALGAAYLSTRNAAPAVSSDDADVNMKAIAMPEWDDLINEIAPEIGDFLRRWIARESGGNPCSTGMWNGPWEAGLGQIYFTNYGDTVRGVTIEQLRVACSGQRLTRALTEDEKRPHVESLVSEARDFIARATTSVPDWSDEDIMCMAKLWHALPAFAACITAAQSAGQSGSWDEFRAWMESQTQAQIAGINAAAGRFYGKLTALFNNAQSVGRGY